MNEENSSTPKVSPHWTAASQGPQPVRHDLYHEPALHRFLGGSPGSVFLRLVFVSLIVGAFLMWLDISPADIFRGINDLINRIWGLGFEAVRVIGDYILAGAAIVVPVWLVLRLMNMRNVR
ncbi:MAG TPA: DUF6460 domain-containing protein [Methylocella sp.]|nr:DUF6460 domain-containing protein [Methylocella sp.]